MASDLRPTPWKCPEWLLAVAIRINEMVANPAVMQRFRDKLEEWTEARAARARQWAREKADGHERKCTRLALLPERTMGRLEKYVCLAEIHDAVLDLDAAKYIDPWRLAGEGIVGNNIGGIKALGKGFVIRSDRCSESDEPRWLVTGKGDALLERWRGQGQFLSGFDWLQLRVQDEFTDLERHRIEGILADVERNIRAQKEPARHTPELDGPAPDAAEERLKAIPTLDTESKLWVRQAAAARILLGQPEESDDPAADNAKGQKKIAALKKARSRVKCDSEMTKGIDNNRNVWRYDPHDRKTVWYLKSSLTDKTKPLLDILTGTS